MDDSKKHDGLLELALFAGAGGGILGGHLLGWRTVCAVERDLYAASVLASRQNDGCLPPFPVWSDVSAFRSDNAECAEMFDALRSIRGRLVISGGFPCQDISCAGKGAGLEGERSGLWGEFARIIREIRPRYAFVENSPMLASRGLGTVLGDLAEAGYDARWCVLGADDIGAPHRRKRIWILANAIGNHISGEPRVGSARRVGGEHKHVPWDTTWRDSLSRLRGMGDGLANLLDRCNAIRNGQIPAVAATAWRILTPN